MQIGVVMGGISTEKEVSYLTGKYIIESLDKSKYEVLPIPINTKYELIDAVKCLEFAFIALHGSFGEDGKVQALLETIGVPYSGSGVLTSALCMDKDMSKKMFLAEKIQTPCWTMIKKEEEIDYNKVEKMGYPVIVKPNNGGSSIGVAIVYSKEDLKKAVKEALEYDEEVMIEEYIKGEEITCCMLDREVLPVLSIKTKEEFFNYSSKYDENGAEEKVIKLPDTLQKKVEEICIKCWDNFKLKVYGRIDMIIKNGEVYVLEINTLPGMTKNSLFPKSAAAYGLSFSELLDRIIESSLNINKF
ncbi:D-alanine-D-alanine ligase [Clostridium tetanomorphum]|uniref:D-alanine--D-alanine ligase n=1 Tax=Clostridium tetanomorphum TaxID=1553 RepID=A0A923J0K6_CLOTT|nr:D-alanine--D-alanine ligase [Clostridium tetanomorphum]KAJ52933.1 D-alanine--D-alanine ligase [Clostridium tetanomorphum DSM 665]MBC2398187.1 D-alanine--D-alanine ligase [Clostridium tetanomorphum]MBP1864873.1 D-alanine-D-alanine ligase [Clostridium tetanomorphum]NRS83079.1 D-alanine-D-alanine ligase [Clostridium tetanomorphum]NRZ98824.1 D-alanine-D-alanine ligase [Clostridium tetanomorphum]